jgi:hypothetical protein
MFVPITLELILDWSAQMADIFGLEWTQHDNLDDAMDELTRLQDQANRYLAAALLRHNASQYN